MEAFNGFICDDSVSSTDIDSDEHLQNSSNFGTQKKNLASSELKAKKTRCLTRNALMARENRRRKKMYLESIEREAKLLREANHQLEVRNKKNNKVINSLKKEVVYLKNVLSNNSNIEKLILGINKALNPKVIVKTEATTNPRLDGPLLGDPLFSAPSNSSRLSASLAEATNQENLQEDEMPQSFEKKSLVRVAATLPMDLQGAVIFVY
ncbi:uncharacterized protein isoform X2 [Rhodnius prolixus]|uniref:BZIP domain-containing protein n=1 Tax=Rhodnius prolixus TaxID=13249 RepID=T1HXX6_RHOPR